MQWWNDVVTWFNSAAGARVISTAILPFIAIVVAGLVAAWIASGFARRIIEHQDREIKAASIMALIGAGRRAAIWSSLGADEKQHVDSLISEADLRMRLLPVSGAIAAADWATHELNAMKKNSANFSYQAEQTFFDYRDRLLDWQSRPKRAKKLFGFDLVQWQYDDDSTSQSSLVAQQQEWAAEHVQPSTASMPSVPSAVATGQSVTTVPAPRIAPTTTPRPVATPENGGAQASGSDDVDDEVNPVAPPVTAGAVRNRTAPETTISGS
jgi:hypothetical protein